MTTPSARADVDAGFSLIEVVVAMAVFTILASVSLGLLINTTGVAGGNIRRTTATNLVNAQLQAARSLNVQLIPDGRVDTYQDVGNIRYKISQTANYVAASGSTSICSGSGNSLAYKAVSVSVTWPNMGSIKPVRGDTLRAVGVGDDGLDATLGTVALSVVGSTSQTMSGVDIVLSPGGDRRTTGDDGCAIFVGLTPGTYTATANMPGYVGTANAQAATSNGLAVTAGAIARGTLLYDTRRSVNVVFDAPAGTIVPAGLVLRAGNSYVPESTLATCAAGATSACVSAVPGVVQNLFPESYQFKAGTCTEPTPSQIAADLRPTSANNTTVTVPVGWATVKVVLAISPTIGLAGRTITAQHVSAAGCSAGETYTTTSVAAGSVMLVPYGTWTFSSPSAIAQAFTFSPTSKTATVTLQAAL